MRKLIVTTALLVLHLMAASCQTREDMNYNTPVSVTINGKTFEAVLADNATGQAFAEMLPLTLTMNELNGNEKYHYLDSSLPTASFRPNTINAGDLLLYGDNCVVLFYKTFSSSYSYTRIGKLTNTDGLLQAVGTGNAAVTFAPASTTGLTAATAAASDAQAYTLSGQPAPTGYKGVTVQQGKKQLKR